MTFSRPTLSELVTRTKTDMETRLGLAPVLRRSFIGVLARVWAGIAHGLYGFITFISDQLLWDTAIGAYLIRWAAIFGITPIAATFADGNITLTGTNGAVSPAGTLWQTSDGVQYSQDADATISGGTATAAVTCLTEGEIGNLDAAEPLQIVSPVSGITSSAVVAVGGLTGGTDTESDEDLRIRFLERVRTPPTGGSFADYVHWSKQVAGVTRVWVYPNGSGAGTVNVLFVRDNDGTGIGADILPSAGEISDVQDVLDEEAPVTVTVTAAAPTQLALNINLTISPDTTAIRAAVTAELQDLVNREAEPAGAYNAVNNGKIELTHIAEAISRAEGEFDHVINTVQGIAPADVQPSAGQMVRLGTITFA